MQFFATWNRNIVCCVCDGILVAADSILGKKPEQGWFRVTIHRTAK
jgi:hypothetical protein